MTLSVLQTPKEKNRTKEKADINTKGREKEIHNQKEGQIEWWLKTPNRNADGEERHPHDLLDVGLISFFDHLVIQTPIR